MLFDFTNYKPFNISINLDFFYSDLFFQNLFNLVLEVNFLILFCFIISKRLLSVHESGLHYPQVHPLLRKENLQIINVK
jgi:hypothetical protein